MEKRYFSGRITYSLKHTAYYWLPVVVWMGVIFLLSGRRSITVTAVYIWNFLFFKMLHVVEYAVLYVLSVRALNAGNHIKRNSILLHAFVFTILFAITDEVHQTFVPTREGKLRDVIIDAIGAGFVWFYLLKKLPTAQKQLRFWAQKLDLP